MLKVTEQQMVGLREAGLRTLRQTILDHWRGRLSAAAQSCGPDGRDRVLDRVEAAAREDSALSIADLTMLADLMLVDAAPQPRPH